MKKEIEAKFLNIDHQQLRIDLEQLGAVQETPMFTMKRVMLDYPDRRLGKKQAFARVRQEYGRVTMAYKEIEDQSLHGVHEAELEVADFEDAVNFCKAIGMVALTTQESRREIWRAGESEVVLDEWPWLNPYIEIEAPAEDSVRNIADLLGLNWNDAVFGDVMSAYRAQYPNLPPEFQISDLIEVKFTDPIPPAFSA